MWFVYVDYTNDGRPFYVGKGDSRRIRQPTRNWKHGWVTQVLGCVREIVLETSVEKAALQHEIHLIKVHDTYTTNYARRLADIRCNFTRGGDGLSGHRDSPETRHKKHLAATKMGQNPDIQRKKSIALKGRTFSSETKLKMQRRRAVCQLSIIDDSVIAVYQTVKEAEDATGAHSSCICMCCRGKIKTSGGFRWRYLETT